MTHAILAALFMTISSPAFANPPQLPAGITCEIVRAQVAEHGRYVAWAWARLQGYSKAEIAEARKCLR